MSVNLPGNGSCVNVRLEGEIKNASVMMSRDIRVGIEFIRLSETEQAITAALSVMSDTLFGTETPRSTLRNSATADSLSVNTSRRIATSSHPR